MHEFRRVAVPRNEVKSQESTMSVHKRVAGALVLSLILAQAASAQDRGLGFTVRGGGFNSLTDLNEAGTADFGKTGYSAGAGVDFGFHKNVALRGDLTFARNELRQNDVATGRDLSRLFYDAAIQLQYPAGGLKPYVFVGAGAVTLHQVGSDVEDKTKFAGTGGLGLSYQLPGSGFSIGVEGKGWLYELSELPGQLSSFDKTAFDAAWTAGISYRIPSGASAARANR
jgi:opacity protein-like surface antigen